MKKLLTVGLLTGALLVGSIGNAFAAEKIEAMELKNAKLNVVEISKDDKVMEDFVIGEVIVLDAKDGETLLIEPGDISTKQKLSFKEIQKLIEKGIIKADIKNDKIIIKK